MNIAANITSNENNVTTTTQNKAELSLSNASAGDSFQGEILDVRGNNVRIKVGNYVLNALLENGVNVNIGDRLSFLVKGNEGDKVFLKPFADQTLANSNSLVKILNEASLNATERNLAAMKELMSNGMPIDKNSMQEIGKILINFKDANVQTLISMKSHNIPINDENIKMFEAYSNSGGKITENIKNIINELSGMGSKGNDTPILLKTVQFLNNVNEMLQLETEKQQPEMQNQKLETALTENVGTRPAAEQGAANENVKNANIQTIPQAVTSEKFTEETVEKIVEKTVDMAGEKTAIKVPVNDAGVLSEQVEKLIKEITEKIGKKIFISPGKLAEKGNEAIRQVYENIAEIAEKLTESVKASGNNEMGAKLMEHTAELKNNLNFMSDMNEMAAYAQIPVKLNNREQNSELYVLSRNRKKTSKDGPLTAFLHLDMESLGATDVRVSMENSKVSTKFTLDNDESMKLVENHLDELKLRLEELGYQVSLSAETMMQKRTPFEDILEADRPKQNIKRFSFDVRA